MSRSFLRVLCGIAVLFGAVCIGQNLFFRASQAADAPALLPVHRYPIPKNAQTATFAGGCFWGVEETFRLVPGVVDTQAGYTGGTSAHPTYRTVHSDTTGHTEAVRVVFDPARVSYQQLLTVFFANRSVSTTAPKRSRIGSAYRDRVFTENAAQNAEARKMVQMLRENEARASGDTKNEARRVTVGIVSAQTFWPAEDEHQRYYEKRGGQSAGGAACRL